MTTIIGLTAERMQEIEAASIVDGEVIAGDLILTKHDGNPINAGSVIGPVGPPGPIGSIPGEIKLWPSLTLPSEAEYGLWTWANGGIFVISEHPLAAGNIDDVWNTAMGLAAPGAGNFRVPDLRGLVPAGLDAMPFGATRINRMTRAAALTIAAKTGEETHVLTLAESASHTHPPAVGSAFIMEVGGSRSVGTGAFTLDNAASTGAAGGNGAHETVQPTIMVPYIVKLDD